MSVTGGLEKGNGGNTVGAAGKAWNGTGVALSGPSRGPTVSLLPSPPLQPASRNRPTKVPSWETVCFAGEESRCLLAERLRPKDATGRAWLVRNRLARGAEVTEVEFSCSQIASESRTKPPVGKPAPGRVSQTLCHPSRQSPRAEPAPSWLWPEGGKKPRREGRSLFPLLFPWTTVFPKCTLSGSSRTWMPSDLGRPRGQRRGLCGEGSRDAEAQGLQI